MAGVDPLRPSVHGREVGLSLETQNNELQAALGHSFERLELLEEALTHSSATADNGAAAGKRDYERLEFLGDRVLGLAVAQLLMQRYADEKVGALARRHSALVRRETLAEVAGNIGLGTHIILSNGEEEAGGRENPAILADCCEAVIAALYLDGGLPAAVRFIYTHWTSLMSEAMHPPKDPKTALQEWAQGRGLPLPAYTVLETKGPDHAPMFSVQASVRGFPDT
ncbi:MAG: ribonuclease III, partial [Pseudomonadota bacterium]